MSAAAAPAPPGISVCSAPTCQPIAACTIGADVGSWKEVERVFMICASKKMSHSFCSKLKWTIATLNHPFFCLRRR